MPTYDYECPKGHRFELFQKMSDEPKASCPECGAAASRLISGGAGFLFKGDGFYITDYRSDEYKKKASAEGPSSGGSTSTDKAGGSGKSEAKGEKGGSGSAGGSSSGSSSSGSAAD